MYPATLCNKFVTAFVLFLKKIIWGLLCHHRSEKKRVHWFRNVITDAKWHALCSWLPHHYTKMITYQHGGNKKRVVTCREMVRIFITVFLFEGFKEAATNYINSRLFWSSLPWLTFCWHFCITRIMLEGWLWMRNENLNDIRPENWR